MQPSTPPPSSSTALASLRTDRRHRGRRRVVGAIVPEPRQQRQLHRDGHHGHHGGAAASIRPECCRGATPRRRARTSSIDWGSRCDTTRGTLKYPSFFAGACYTPFKGNNGGATAPGVTASTIKVVLLPGAGGRPDPEVHRAADRRHRHQRRRRPRPCRTGSTFYRPLLRDLRPQGRSWSPSRPPASRATRSRPGPTPSPSPNHQAVRGRRAVRSSPPRSATSWRSDHMLCLDCGPEPTRRLLPSALAVRLQPGPCNADELQVHRRRFHRHRAPGTRRASTPGEADFTHEKRKFGDDLHHHRPGRRDAAEALRGQPGQVRRPPRPGAGVQDPDQAADRRARRSSPSSRRPGDTSVIFVGDPVAPRSLTKAATGPELLPRVDHHRSRADRHHHLRPHLRPEAVVARVRRVDAGRPHRPLGQRRPLRLQLVLRAQASGQDRSRGHRSRLQPPLLGAAGGRSEPDRPDVRGRALRRTSHQERRHAAPDLLRQPRDLAADRLPGHRRRHSRCGGTRPPRVPTS